MARLIVENLTKSFGGVVAVDDVSFEVGAGEFVSLLGPSGCGKTTTLRCIAGFERPDRGRIRIDDDPITDVASGVFVPPNRRRFGMVFQSYAVWPHMTVLNNVGYPLKVQGGHGRSEIRDRVMEQLRVVGLDGYENRYPSQLSGGQQQRVALARALVMSPRVLLFDEPLSNLDAKLRERMRFELTEIQSKLGIPAVYVTHDQSEAMVMSDRVIVMDSGHIAQSGPPEEVYARPNTRFVADFIGLSNFVHGEVRSRAANGHWHVACPLGEFLCVSEREHRQGERVLLAFRPERVEMGATPFTGDNVFKAELRKRYFLGPYSELFLEVEGEQVRVQTSTVPGACEGGRMFGRIAPDDFRVVSDSSHSVN